MVEETGTCSTLNLQRDVSRNICVSVKLITLHQPLTQYLTPGAALTALQNSRKRHRFTRPAKTKSHKTKNIKRQKLLDSVEQVLASHCCQKECIHFVEIDKLVQVRKTMARMNEKEKLNYVVSWLTNSHTSTSWAFLLHGMTFFYHTIFIIIYIGHALCCRAFRFVLGISRWKFSRAQQIWKAGGLVSVHGNAGLRFLTPKTQEAYTWLSLFIKDVGEPQPDGKIQIPPSLCWKLLHNLMAKELKALGKPILELTGFQNLVKQYFPDVFLPRTCRLGKCGICTTFVQE